MAEKKRKGAGKKTLFTIGEMARLFHMNIRTLRYYDEIGVLKPEYVNEETNYRYYSTVQFERLNTIKYLRALDVPLEKILLFLNEKDVNTILSIFVEQHESVVRKQEQLSRIEKKITKRMEQIKAALTAPYGKVIVKQIPQRKVVLLEKKITREEDLEPLIRDISKKYDLDDAIFLGKVGVSVSKEDLEKKEFAHFSSIFIIVEDEDDFIDNDVVLQEGMYVTIQYRGTHEDAPLYYAMVFDYLIDSGFHLKGDSIEITMIDAGMTTDQSQFVTELQIPIS